MPSRATDNQDVDVDHIAQVEQERRDQLVSEGTCVMCGESTYNPMLPIPVCTNCHDEADHTCSYNNCTNKGKHWTKFDRMCSVHVVEFAQELYQQYLQQKATIEEEKRILYDLMSEHNVTDGDFNRSYTELSKQEQRVVDMKDNIAYSEMELSALRQRIETIDSYEGVQVFPDGFTPAF